MVWHVFCIETERIACNRFLLPWHMSNHNYAKVADNKFLCNKPTQEVHQTLRGGGGGGGGGTWAEEACMLFTAVSRPSSQWFVKVNPENAVVWSEVHSEAWVEKIKSHSVSLIFQKGSNCCLLKFYSSGSLIFVFPRGMTFFSTFRRQRWGNF